MIRIVIAEEQQLLLGALESLLHLEDDMKVVGQADNGVDAIKLVDQLQPDICILDMDLPNKSGLDAAEELKGSSCKVVILTTFVRRGSLKRTLKAGVMGYLLKDNPSELLANSIRGVMAGKLVYESILLDEEKNDETLQRESPMSSAVGFQPPTNSIGSVKSYFSTIIEKIKMPTG